MLFYTKSPLKRNTLRTFALKRQNIYTINKHMTIKSILSSLFLIYYAILVSSSSGPVDMLFWILFASPFVLGIYFGIKGFNDEKKKQKEERLHKETKTAEYNAMKEKFLAANGKPDKSIIIVEHDINSEIHVYEAAKRVFIMGKEYSFNDVMSCTVSSQERVIKGNVTATTETSNGSAAGRAIVGGIIAGPAGAIIGGSTAEKRTEFVHEDDKVMRDYTVNITMNSISEPIINIHTGEDVNLTNEVVSLMNVIIAKK